VAFAASTTPRGLRTAPPREDAPLRDRRRAGEGSLGHGQSQLLAGPTPVAPSRCSCFYAEGLACVEQRA
jgi:hypothetical protein